jgi:hypothetical protein
VSTPVQLRIAARIHFLLKRDLGEGINVATMLNDSKEAREVLFVCQASGNPELVSLARQFINARQFAKPDARAGDAPQDTMWSRNTSGFGLLQPHALAEAQPVPNAPREPEDRSWRSATQWLRRGVSRIAR